MGIFLSRSVCCAIVFISFYSMAIEFKTVGQSRFQYYFWDVYDATLATPSGTYKSAQHPVKLSLTYLRDFAAKDILNATNEQWQHLGKVELIGKYDQQLLSLWPDIKEGETLSFVTDAQGHGVFYHQQKKLGGVEAKGFANDFLAIWLSADTSEPTMRKQLIGAQ
ncbi:chalcone isomerase family protein [Pseudoalteromonas shioyasakiensis]|nr:chalcone isomerase family protein [Pseudoalteromonas shioyasakiensis]MCQ8878393.1 chalcone isomerase family protein [Pseudoalteromonas shioyasakiensis]